MERALEVIKFFVDRAGGSAHKSQIHGIAHNLYMIAKRRPTNGVQACRHRSIALTGEENISCPGFPEGSAMLTLR